MDDPERKGRYIVGSDRGRLYVWNSCLIELADIMARGDFKDNIQVVFYRKKDDNRYHVREVTEKLD